jgi:hypothetical protein
MPSYKEVLKLEYDKRQMQFAIDGTLIINKRIINEKTPILALINEAKYWICPFCLETSNKFIIENKGLIKCPNCLINMKIKTLLFVKDCTNQEYAKWVYEYRLSGFFTKLKSGNNSFEKWNKKMQELGINYEFWEEYKKLKGEETGWKEEPEFNSEQLEDIIKGLVKFINEGKTKEDILVLLNKNNVEFKRESFEYCFLEAKLRIKNNGV